MKKILLLAATAALSVLGANAQSWTAPQIPSEGSVVVSGEKYVVKNIGASKANSQGMFLTGGSSWFSWATSTVLMTEENALIFTLTETEKGWTLARQGDGKFTFISAASPVGNEGWGEMHVDQGSQAENLRYFNLLKQEGNVYRIQASEANSTYYDANKFWGWCMDEEHAYPTAVYATVSAEGFAVDWEFIPMNNYLARVELYNALVESEKYSSVDASAAAAVYNNTESTIEQIEQATSELLAVVKDAALAQASEENPLDVTEWLKNPSFDTSISGWEIDMPNNKAGGGGYQTSGKYHNEEANAHCDNFIECWIAQNTTGLRNGHIQQTISDMPQGKYRLTVDCIAVQQAGQEHTGVQLFCTGGEIDTYQEIATQNGKPETFQIDFVNSGGDLTMGLRCIETNANWIAADNFHLYYMGKVADPLKYALETAITESQDKYPELDDVKANKDVKAAYSTALENAQTAVETSTGDYQALKNELTGAENNLLTSIKEYEVAKDMLTTIEGKIKEAEANAAWEDLAGDLGDLYNSIEGSYNECELTSEEIAGLSKRVTTVIGAFISENCKAGDDVTILLNNPDFTSNFKGWDMTGAGVDWQNNYGNGENNAEAAAALKAPNRNDGLAERYHAKFTMTQTIYNMPRGLYTLSCQGFNRHDDGENDKFAELYAVLPDASVQTHHFADIEDYATEEKLFDNTEGNDVDPTNHWRSDSERGGKWVPNSMTGAAWHFMNKSDGENYDYMSKIDIVLTENGDLTLGARCEYEHQWVIFDSFRIIYQGSGASVYAGVINEKIKALNEAIDAGCSAEANEIAQQAITNAENALENNDEEACIASLNELDEALTTVHNSTELIEKLSTEYTIMNDYRMNTVESNEETFPDYMGEIAAALEDADFASDAIIQGYRDGMKAGFTKYVQFDGLEDASEENPWDMTAVIYNTNGIDPVSEEASVNGWSQAAGLDGISFEEFNCTYDFYQDIFGLAPGYYRLRVNGFYRNGGYAVVEKAMNGDMEDKYVARLDENGDTIKNEAGEAVMDTIQVPMKNEGLACLYAGSTETSLALITSELEAYNQLADITGADVTIKDVAYKIPDSMAQAGVAFQNDLYQNVLQFQVAEGEDVTRIGVKKSVAKTSDWTIFTNWSLEFIGTEAPAEDPSTAVQSVISNIASGNAQVFGVDGQLKGRLTKGVNIVKSVLSDGTVRIQKVLVR